MNNYLLLIDPSIKDTGFVLWEKQNKKCHDICPKTLLCDEKCLKIYWKPIWVNNYNFEKFNWDEFVEKIYQPEFIDKKDMSLGADFIDIYIERGFNSPLNSRSRERMESLRGNIYGLFNKFYIPDKHGIPPNKWFKYFTDNYSEIIREYKEIIIIDFMYKNNLTSNVFVRGTTLYKKWMKYLKKELSKMLAQYFINQNNWNIDIKDNHNIADALLMGVFKINNEI